MAICDDGTHIRGDCHSFIAWSLCTAACTHLAKEVHHFHLYGTRIGSDMISHRIQNSFFGPSEGVTRRYPSMLDDL
jgi:hypothetical protein